MTNPCNNLKKSIYQFEQMHLSNREIHVTTLKNPFWTNSKRGVTDWLRDGHGKAMIRLGSINEEIDLLWSRSASLWKNYEHLGKKITNYMLLYKVTIVWELWESFASKQIWITIGDILLQRQKCPPSCMAMWGSRQNGH